MKPSVTKRHPRIAPEYTQCIFWPVSWREMSAQTINFLSLERTRWNENGYGLSWISFLVFLLWNPDSNGRGKSFYFYFFHKKLLNQSGWVTYVISTQIISLFPLKTMQRQCIIQQVCNKKFLCETLNILHWLYITYGENPLLVLTTLMKCQLTL